MEDLRVIYRSDFDSLLTPPTRRYLFVLLRRLSTTGVQYGRNYDREYERLKFRMVGSRDLSIGGWTGGDTVTDDFLFTVLVEPSCGTFLTGGIGS